MHLQRENSVINTRRFAGLCTVVNIIRHGFYAIIHFTFGTYFLQTLLIFLNYLLRLLILDVFTEQWQLQWQIFSFSTLGRQPIIQIVKSHTVCYWNLMQFTFQWSMWLHVILKCVKKYMVLLSLTGRRRRHGVIVGVPLLSEKLR